MTNLQVLKSFIWGLGPEVDKEKVMRGEPEAKELNYWHPSGEPFGVLDSPDLKTIDDEIKLYKDGFMIYDMVDINPQKFKSSIIENWWVIFKRDLSLTKGLLSELQRHQNKLILQRDEFLKNNPEKEI